MSKEKKSSPTVSQSVTFLLSVIILRMTKVYPGS